MQRLGEIETRRRQLLAELEALDAEEHEIKRSLAQTAAADPTLVALVQRSTTQHGCAEAQTRLDNVTPDERAAIFGAALGDLRNLLMQTYSALFFQKLLETSTQAELARFAFALNVGSSLGDVASSPSGARIVQRFMELVGNSDISTQFMHTLSARIVTLSNDINGSHIVQRALSGRMTQEKEIVVDALINNCVAIATNKQGCCVLQRAIDWLPDVPRDRVITAVIQNELELVQDAFGNYVVQHLLDRKDDTIAKRAIQPLLHNIAALACNKFGSNVIEKCVRIANPNIKQLLVDELTDPSVLPRLLQDSFANYVIQTAIACSTEDQFQQLHAAIRPSFAALKNSPYGVRIEAKIQRRLKDNARSRQRQNKKKGSDNVPMNITAPAPHSPSFSSGSPVGSPPLAHFHQQQRMMGAGHMTGSPRHIDVVASHHASLQNAPHGFQPTRLH